MNTQYLALEGIALWLGLLKTNLSTTSLVRLFQSSFVPNSGSSQADFVAAEANYDGYTPGGEPLGAWQDPILGPGTGMSMGSPLVLFETDPAIVTGNLIGGFWVEDAASKVITFGKFAAPVPMQVAFQGFPWNCRIALPTGE